MSLLEGAIVPGSVKVSWMLNGVAKTAQASTAGVFTGDGTGTVDHNSGKFSMEPTLLPAIATDIRYEWVKQGTKVVVPLASLNLSQLGNQVTGALPDAPIYPGQTVMTLQLDCGDDSEVISSVQLAVYDNGNGDLYYKSGTTTVKIGDLDYETGGFVIHAPDTMYFMVKVYGWRNPNSLDPALKEWVHKTTERQLKVAVLKAPGVLSCAYLPASSPANCDKTYPLAALTVDFTPRSQEVIVAGSVRLGFGGRTYIDRNGLLYSNVDPLTGAGEQSGTIDYQNGTVRITKWTEGAINAQVVVQSLLTTIDDHTVSSVAFRTPLAPVRPGSLYIRCTDKDGANHDITVSSDGKLNSDIFDGTVDYETGVVKVRFGRLVKASDHLDAEWYDQNLVDVNGNVWKPAQVRADSLRYNCVTYSYLPLDADIIKLDPVRLPTDGRVPILRKGKIAVIHSTQRKAWPNGVMAGQQLTIGRTRLSKCWLEDDTGKKLDASLYSADLDLGIVTLATPLILTGYTQPLVAVHRVEDTALMTDVEISGRLTLSKPLSHDFSAADTYVSSAMVIDDLWARVSNVFDQAAWTGKFSDTLIGDGTSAQFNNTDYPIAVTNRGALTERYALIFTSSTQFKVIGEHLGQIAIGTVNEVCAPSNPNHPSIPLFSINPQAWGGGWAAGNVLRFNVNGANAPIWMVRTILQSEASVDSDEFALQLRGNVIKD